MEEETKFDESKLIEQIEIIKKILRTDMRYDPSVLPRPFMVELTGSPGSGKSLTTQVLYDFLRIKGLRVSIPQEAAEKIQHIPRTTPLYNIRTGLESLTLITDQSAWANYDIIFFNRAIFDAYSWMEYWFRKNKLSSLEKYCFQSFFVSRFTVPLIDQAYIMTCEAEVAMKREFRVTISRQNRETTNPESIRNLVNIFKSSYKDLSLVHNQLQFIDTTNMTEQEMVDIVAQDLISALSKSR